MKNLIQIMSEKLQTDCNAWRLLSLNKKKWLQMTYRNSVFENFVCEKLTHSMPLSFIPPKISENFRFSGGIERDQRHEMD